MILDADTAKQIAKSLLQIKAIILNPDEPFKWASGWNSPIYCDNRKILGCACSLAKEGGSIMYNIDELSFD